MALVVVLAGAWNPVRAIDAAVDRYILAEMELNGIPGLSLAVVEDGNVTHTRAYGIRSVESGADMRVDTPVDLASVSKSLTALGVLRLEREGRLHREQTVATVLPEIGDRWRGVTIRHLLRHRSGLRRKDDFVLPCCGAPAINGLDRVASRMRRAVLESTPGETFSYANGNYALLAAVIQRTSGVPFAKYMKKEIFEPNGMRSTTVDAVEAAELGMSDRHERQWGRVGVSPSLFLGWYGSSRVKASAADMGSYLTTLLDPRLTRVGISVSGGAWWTGLEPEYDLGWTVWPEAEWLSGQLVLEHTGKIWGGDTAVVLAPRRQAAVAVLANLGSDRAGRMARAILASRFGADLPQPQRSSRAEDPDTWAQVFLAVGVGLFAATLWYGFQVLRQVRGSTRGRRTTGWGLLRAVVLVGLAAKLIHSAAWASTPPPAALPTTIGVALPVLVGSVTAVLLLAAVVGFFPRSKS